MLRRIFAYRRGIALVDQIDPGNIIAEILGDVFGKTQDIMQRVRHNHFKRSDVIDIVNKLLKGLDGSGLKQQLFRFGHKVCELFFVLTHNIDIPP